MAKFNENSVPTEFIATLRQLTSEIEDLTNAVAKEKQLIDSLENDIHAKREETKRMQADNAELEDAVKHTNNIFEKLKEQLKVLNESNDILKQQVKLKEDMFDIQQKKNKKILDDCEAKFKEYCDKLDERLRKYETFPFVAALKKEINEVNHLQENLNLKKEELQTLKAGIEEARSTRDVSKLKFCSITDWGVAVAKLMRKIAEQKNAQKERASLKEEIARLTAQKKEIEMVRKVNKAKSTQRQLSEKQADGQNVVGHPKSRGFQLPSFDHFFKLKPNVVHKFGTSGSSLRKSVLSSSLPSIPATLSSPKTPNEPKKQDSHTIKTPPISSVPDVGSKSPATSFCPSFHRSKSLSFLVPHVKPFKRTDSSSKGTSMLGKSLSDWLNPGPPESKNLEVIHEQMEVIDDKPEEEVERQPLSPKKTQPPVKMKISHPVVHMSAEHKATEVPLIRQIQEKIMHKKAIEHGDQLLQERILASNEPVEMVMEEETEPEKVDMAPKPTENVLALFEGPSYDVPMPSLEEEEARVKPTTSLKLSPERALSDQPPTQPSPEQKMTYLQEHDRWMMELKKSPEFSMSTKDMPTDRVQILMSPQSIGCPSNVQSPTTPEGNNLFAVPNQPDANSKSRTSSPNKPFTFDFGSSKTGSAECGDSLFGTGFFGSANSGSSVFDFGATGESTSKPSSPSPFSFNFCSQNTSPPSESPNPFAFRFGSKAEGGASNASDGFSFGAAAKSPEASSGGLFSSIFGCK